MVVIALAVEAAMFATPPPPKVDVLLLTVLLVIVVAATSVKERVRTPPWYPLAVFPVTLELVIVTVACPL